MTGFRFLASAFSIVIGAITFGMVGLPSTDGATTSYRSLAFANSSFEVDDLIQRLDSSRFASREKATNELIELGSDSLEPAAMHFLNASPEAAWRIKRVLEKISIQSNEEATSLKAIGILMLLDHKVDTELAELIQKWRENRSQRAIQYLVDKGALTSPSGVHRRLLVQQPFQRGFQVQTHFSNPPKNPLRPAVRVKLPPEKLRSEIEKVVNGDFDEVQKFVFDRLPGGGNPNDQLVEDPFVANALMGGIGTGNQNRTFLEFGEKWIGQSADFERLKEIHSLIGVRFKDLKVDVDDLHPVTNLSGLQHLGFANAKFSSGELTDLRIPASVTSIELANHTIEIETLQWLSSKPLQTLTIDGCKITEAAVNSFDELEHLRVLSVARCQVKPTMFDTWLGMSELKRISLSVCKFPPNAYRQFNQIRPRVIIFNPVSFLGVQGVQNRRGTVLCEIEMVVEGSGAERAGIQPGDIIMAVNDDPIESFNELRMFISQYDIGEDMKLTVRRGDEEIELNAQLGTNTTPPLR